MRLVLQLVARLLLIVALCLGAATVWATFEAYRSVDRATAASAQRVAQTLQALYWHELLLRSSRAREHLLPVSEWRTLDTMKLISPGVCVEFQPAVAFEKPLCGQSEGLGKTPPRWFASIVPTFLGSHAEVVRPVSPRAAAAGTVVATPDAAAAISLAWEYILNVIDVALLMATAIALLASLAIAHTLVPARAIVTALQRMARGHYRTKLPRFRSMELAMIGGAVGELGTRLEEATEQRAALTRRLIEIRDDERRALARELHDEFGQNLAAILAFADTIETASAKQNREDGIAQDARMISQATHHLMASLRDALKRLRNPLPEELGLEASLVNLVDSWRSQSAARPTIQLDLRGDLTDISGPAATTAYRVAQECLTNALRHGAAREISLRVERRAGEDDALLIRVEDDGGGDAERVARSAGFGLTGIRERVAAAGGSLSILPARGGLSVAATIPLAA
ncbi:signal transduction histidine kinase [Bradyrhizobium diazoefficiens]|uniref:sensor histidine kinase n=1 Tax=Bradyrhizobium diazoefficiens TaxID=1355477 RepID=UPI00347DE072